MVSFQCTFDGFFKLQKKFRGVCREPVLLRRLVITARPTFLIGFWLMTCTTEQTVRAPYHHMASVHLIWRPCGAPLLYKSTNFSKVEYCKDICYFSRTKPKLIWIKAPNSINRQYYGAEFSTGWTQEEPVACLLCEARMKLKNGIGIPSNELLLQCCRKWYNVFTEDTIFH